MKANHLSGRVGKVENEITQNIDRTTQCILSMLLFFIGVATVSHLERNDFQQDVSLLPRQRGVLCATLVTFELST